MNRCIEGAPRQRQQRFVKSEAEPVINVVGLGRDLTVTKIQPQVLIAISVVAEQLCLLQVTNTITDVPARRRVIDLAHQLIRQSRFTNTPLRDDCEHVREAFRFVIHQMNKVFELIEEASLADDRM